MCPVRNFTYVSARSAGDVTAEIILKERHGDVGKRKRPAVACRPPTAIRKLSLSSPELDVRQNVLIDVTQIQDSTNIRLVRANAHTAGIRSVAYRIGGYATCISGSERGRGRATLIDDQRLRRPKLIGDLESC